MVSGYFDVVAYAPSQAEVTRAIDEGRAQAGIVIPPDFSARVERGDAQVLFLVDGSDLFTSQSAYNAAIIIAQAHATEVLMEKVERSGLVADSKSFLPLDARVRILYNPNMDDLWFIIPGMCAMILQTQSIALTATAVVRERETGTIEQLLVTPIRPVELMLGKIAPNILLAMINMLTVLGIGVFGFGVPFQGNFWLFLWLSFMYVFSGLGLGLLISTISQNQRQTQQLIMVMMMLGVVLGDLCFRATRCRPPAPRRQPVPADLFYPYCAGDHHQGRRHRVLLGAGHRDGHLQCRDHVGRFALVQARAGLKMRKSLKRIGALVQKEIIQILRDWRTLVLILALPLIELFLFAYAVTLTVDHIPIAVADLSQDAQSRAFIDALESRAISTWKCAWRTRSR